VGLGRCQGGEKTEGEEVERVGRLGGAGRALQPRDELAPRQTAKYVAQRGVGAEWGCGYGLLRKLWGCPGVTSVGYLSSEVLRLIIFV